MIASHGPYNSVTDLMKLEAASASDKELFRKYRTELVALPPGRQFYERINSRTCGESNLPSPTSARAFLTHSRSRTRDKRRATGQST